MKIIMMALIGHLLVGTITGMAQRRQPISLLQKIEMMTSYQILNND